MANDKQPSLPRRLIGQIGQGLTNWSLTPPGVRDSSGLFQFGESNLVDPSKPGKPAPDVAGSMIKSQVAERWIQQVTQEVTPEKMTAYLDEMIMGDCWNGFALFEEIEEKWPELRIALFKHKMKAARRNPRIVPPDKPQNPDVAKAKADLANYVFAGMSGWHETAFNLLDAVGKGISAAEIDWAIGEIQGKQAVTINAMPWVLHRHISWWWDKPEVQLFPDLRNRGLHIDVPDRKFVFFHHLSKSGHPSRGALLRPLAWYFLIYIYAIKDWSTLAETFGIDVAHAFCHKDATQEQRNKILMHLARIAARAGVFDEGTVVNLQRATGSASAPQEAIVKYVSEKAIQALLGSTLATESGDKGARALGLVQQDETEELIDWSCLLFSGRMTATALRWLMDFNFAQPGDNPVFEMPGANRRDLAALANVLNILARLGVPIPISWTQSQFDIPAPKEGAGGSPEEILIPQQSTAQPDPGDPGSNQDEGEALTGKAMREGSEAGTGANFGRITMNQAQTALDRILHQAIRKGQADKSFMQIVGPLQKLIARDLEPAAALAQLQTLKHEIKPEKLTELGTQVLVLSELVGRWTANETRAKAA